MSRKKPSNEEIVEAVRESMRGYHSVANYEDIRVSAQRRLRTVASTAKNWIFDALTDPEQDRFVLLRSDDSKWTHRIQRNGSDGYSYYGELHPDRTLMLRLDYAGSPASNSGDAVRNVTWIAHRSVVDGWIAELLKEEQEKREKQASEKNARNAEVEEIVGAELSMIRGMLAAAGVTLGDRTVSAWAIRAEKDGKPVRRARATVELPIKSMIKLAKWLQDKGVEPVGPEGIES